MPKFERLKKNKKTDLADQVINRANEQAQIDVTDLKKHGIKKSSMNYSMPIYKVLNNLKVESKIKVHEFVNEAVKEKLEKEYPKECKQIWG